MLGESPVNVVDVLLDSDIEVSQIELQLRSFSD